jgi:hypothetical protein
MLKLLGLALAAAFSTSSLAQESQNWREPVSCDEQSISLRVVSLKRVGPGKLTLSFQAENTANVPLKLGSPVQLVDDQGDEWKFDRGSLVHKVFHPNVNTTATLNYSRDIGGKQAASASISSSMLIGAVGRAKNYGFCAWRVQGIPIQQ